MGRITNAWRALRGIPEFRTVERPVIGSPMKTTLYAAWVPDKNGERVETWDGMVHYVNGETRYYLTCEQAHAENPGGARIWTEDAITVGNDYFVGKFAAAKVQPKPKVAKGRRK